MVDGVIENMIENISSVAAEIRQGEYLSIADQHVFFDNVRQLTATSLSASGMQRNAAGLLLDLSILFAGVDDFYNDAAYARAFQIAWLDCMVGMVDIIYIPPDAPT